MKSKLEIYGLCVCFAAVVCLVIAGSIGGYGLVMAAAPSFTLQSSTYEDYFSDDAYWQFRQRYIEKEERASRPKPDELTRQRLAGLAQVFEAERRDGWRHFINSMMFVLASAVAFALHWRIAARARDEK